MKNLILIFTTYFLFGCGTIFMASYGIKSGKILSSDEIIKSFKLNNLDSFTCYFLNDNIVKDLDMLVARDSNNFLYSNYLLQPLQVIIFNSEKMISHISNCNLGGFPNLNWDQYLTDFPIAYNNSKGFPEINFNQYKNYLSNVKDKENQFENSQYKMLVIYSDFMGRQSKKLIKRTKEYYTKYSKTKSIQLIFVNANNLSIDNF